MHPIRSVDRKGQIMATFAISVIGEFLSLQLIYTEKAKRCLPKVTLPRSFPKQQMLLVIMDKFKRQGNDDLRELCARKNCEIVIVPRNLTKKFQQLNSSVNKAAET